MRRWRTWDLVAIVSVTAVHCAALGRLARAPGLHPANVLLMFLAFTCPILFLSVWSISGVRLGVRWQWLEVPLAALFFAVSLMLIAIVALLIVVHPAAGFLTGTALLALLMYLTSWA
jgi:hypothetical protein